MIAVEIFITGGGLRVESSSVKYSGLVSNIYVKSLDSGCPIICGGCDCTRLSAAMY